MDAALEALRNHHMSLTKASNTYGIPSTTLWQRAHRLGIDTPKKDGPTKSWNEDVLNVALDALRTGSLSANKASKAYGKLIIWPQGTVVGSRCVYYHTLPNS